MTPLVEAAPAKVNLYLHVVGRRGDGYHLLDSLAAFPPIGDELRAEPCTDGLVLSVTGPFGPRLAGDADDLVLRAARALAAATGAAPRARLILTKRLPVASGIGGGSADAAAALRILARLWDVAIPPSVAERLGADVPVCLGSYPVRMTGIGERLSPAPPLPSAGIVLANPGHAIPTPAVFQALNNPFSRSVELPPFWRGLECFVAWLAAQRNDLEPSAIGLCPVVADVLLALRALPECRLARMSGSGATCFGLFASAAEACDAADRLRRSAWWVWGGPLAGAEMVAADLPRGCRTSMSGHTHAAQWGVAKR